MPAWLAHLTLAAAGLAAACVALRAGQARDRLDPVTLYRLGVAVLAGAFGLPGLQVAVGAVRPPAGGRVRIVEHREVRHSVGAAEVATPRPADVRTAGNGNAVSTVPLLALYLPGVAAVAFGHVRRLTQTRRFLRGCRPVTDPGALAVWRRVATDSDAGARVRLLTCPGLAAPCCWGLGRPALVVPEDAAPDDLEWALRHELTHLERGDSLVSVLQGLLTAAYWFHPAAWWLSRRLDEWRELSCDQRVVAAAGRRKPYALALVAFAARLGPRPEPAPGWLHGSGAHLGRRIDALTAPRRTARGARVAVAALLALAGLAQVAAAGVVPAPVEEESVEVEVVLRGPASPGR